MSTKLHAVSAIAGKLIEQHCYALQSVSDYQTIRLSVLHMSNEAFSSPSNSTQLSQMMSSFTATHTDIQAMHNALQNLNMNLSIVRY